MSNLITITKQFNFEGGIPSIPEIKGDSDYTKASDSIAFLKKYYDFAEKKRKEETAPLLKAKKELDAGYKKFTSPVEKAIKEIKSKMIDYAGKQRAAQLAMETEALDKATGDLIVDVMSVDKSQGDYSTSTVRQVKKYRVKDEALRFIEIPTLKMREYIANGVKIPDWMEEFESDVVTIRGI